METLEVMGCIWRHLKAAFGSVRPFCDLYAGGSVDGGGLDGKNMNDEPK